MKYICHRGNMFGPNPDGENKPEYIQIALNAGYEVEIDVWLESDGLYLGHDKPAYKTNRFFLQNKRIWVHCKNIQAYNELSKFININCFFQENDSIVQTSRGYYWAHSKNPQFNNRTVDVFLDTNHFDKEIHNSFAICTDFVGPPSHTLPFDLLILDIDGVMTDCTKMYDRDGKVFGKRYCDLDFTAIKRFKAAGISVCFLSGDKNINEEMAKSRKIDFFHNPPGVDKTQVLNDIKNQFKPTCTAYIGDDYYDLAIMNTVDLSFCPKNSFSIVKNAVTQVIDVKSGEGVIAGLYDIYENEIPYVYPIDSADVNPK